MWAWSRIKPRHPRLSESVKTGPPRFLESPSHTSAPLLDSGQSAHNLAMTVGTCNPQYLEYEDTSIAVISELDDAASVSAAYASRNASPRPMQGSLPGGG